VWLGSPQYKFKLTTAADVEIWTVDNIGAPTIVDASVTTAKLADASVTTAKLADASVTTAKLADASVTTAKLAFDGGALSGMRNLIINGNPVINQRDYVSGTATTGANQYTLDRWRVVTSGQNVSWTDSAGIRTVTAPAGGMEQVIEALNNLGGVHTLSWTGTATATVNGASVANGGQVTITGNTDVTIRMSGGTWSQLQLEQGSTDTPFERRQYGAERALCHRYYYRNNALTYFNGNSGNSNVARGAAKFGVTMRAIPTITVYSGVNLGGTNGFAYVSNTNTTTAINDISAITTDGFDTIGNTGGLPSSSYIYGISFAAASEF